MLRRWRGYRRGVRSAKEWSISTCRTVPGTGIAITSLLRRFPLGQAGELSLTPTFAPGQQGSRPGIRVRAKSRKGLNNNDFSIAPVGLPLSTQNGRFRTPGPILLAAS